MQEEKAFPYIFVINGDEMRGYRSKNKITIPFTIVPSINIGTTLFQKVGENNVEFCVVDMSIAENTLQVGTPHPHKLFLEVENVSAKPYRQNSMINIESITADNMQIGNGNTMNISVKELVEKIIETEDNEAKQKLIALLNNATVANLLGGAFTTALTLMLK